MPRPRATIALLALLLGLAACGGSEDAEPAPVGSDVGATGSDATAVPVAGDTSATTGAHP